MDVIDKISGVGTKWFENEKNNPPSYTRQSMWISYNSGTYKTIASSFEFGHLIDSTGNNTKAFVWGKVMDFFDIPQGSSSGDVDGDGGVDADDLALLADYLAGNVDTLPSATNADTDSSGAVNVTDLTILQNYLVGHIASLPFTG